MGAESDRWASGAAQYPDLWRCRATRGRLYDDLDSAGWHPLVDDVGRAYTAGRLTVEVSYLWPRPGRSAQSVGVRLLRDGVPLRELLVPLVDEDLTDAVGQLLIVQADVDEQGASTSSS